MTSTLMESPRQRTMNLVTWWVPAEKFTFSSDPEETWSLWLQSPNIFKRCWSDCEEHNDSNLRITTTLTMIERLWSVTLTDRESSCVAFVAISDAVLMPVRTLRENIRVTIRYCSIVSFVTSPHHRQDFISEDLFGVLVCGSAVLSVGPFSFNKKKIPNICGDVNLLHECQRWESFDQLAKININLFLFICEGVNIIQVWLKHRWLKVLETKLHWISSTEVRVFLLWKPCHLNYL